RGLANRPVRMAEQVEGARTAVGDVAEEDLTVGELQVAADDQVVAGAVGVRQVIAEAVGGEAGVAANRDPGLHVARVDVQVVKDKGAEVIGDAEAGGRDVAGLEWFKPWSRLEDADWYVAVPVRPERSAESCGEHHGLRGDKWVASLTK